MLQSDSQIASLFASGHGETATLSPLNSAEQSLYSRIFLAQKKSDWKEADRLIAKLDNPLLLGHVYAERYLSHNYQPSARELKQWLNNYADLPQAYDIAQMAGASTGYKRQMLSGYGSVDIASENFNNPRQMNDWRHALGKWRAGDKATAAKLFSAMLQNGDLPAWKKSAAAFWAYRSYSAIGDRAQAKKYLELAATEPRSFYGVLASRQLKQPLSLDKAPQDNDDDAHTPLALRVRGLCQAGRADLAEKEIRSAFPQADRQEKFALLSLAHSLNLASVQIAMAHQLATDAHPLDFARYPVPRWQPQNGFKVDPALIYALVRQESGFHASAVSPGGALGLMQLMPQTADFMKKRIASTPVGLSLPSTASNIDPTFNVALGQEYVQHLLENDLVDGNLIYMLVAYNAGAGRLAAWKNTIAYRNDPLLFVESIPFAETRHYVMQVMTNYWIYSELAGNPSNSAGALAANRWPAYDKPLLPVASETVQAIIENRS